MLTTLWGYAPLSSCNLCISDSQRPMGSAPSSSGSCAACQRPQVTKHMPTLMTYEGISGGS
jgi:hypothetical protein